MKLLRGHVTDIAPVTPLAILLLVLLLVSLFFIPTVHSASAVKGTYGSSTTAVTSGSASFSSSVTSGDLIVAAFGTSVSVSSFSISDSRCGAFVNWKQAGSTVTNTASVQIWYCTATSVGTDTVSVSWTTSARYTLDVYDLTGYTSAGMTTATGTGTGTTIATSTSLSFGSSAFLVSMAGLSASETISTLTTGFSTGDSAAMTLYAHGEYSTSGATTPTTFSITRSSGSTTWAYIGAQFPVGVTLPISCTMAESGATAATVSISVSSGNIYPTSVTCNGGTTNLLGVGKSVTVTATEPADGATTRDRFSVAGSASTTTKTATCSSGICSTWSVSNYEQVSEQFSNSVSGGGSGYSAPTLTCYQLGVQGSCATLSGTLTAYWLDYGTSWSTTNPLTGSSTSQRWDASSGTSGTSSAGGSASPVYYHQYSYTLSYSISGGGSPTAPALITVQFGSAYTPSLTGSATAYWLDSGQSWSVTNPLGGSGSSERWDSSQTASGTVSSSSPTTAGGSLVLTFYNQYAFIFSYSATGGGSPMAPTLTSTQFGAAYAPTITGLPVTYWLDSSASWSLTNPLGGSGASERWDTPQTVSGTVGGTVTTVFTYYNQYLYTLSYSVANGGSGYSAPALTSTQFAGSYNPTLTTTATGYWLDSSATCSVTNPLSGSISSERWDTTTACPAVGASQTIIFVYYNQYRQTLSYSIEDGGTPSAPTAAGIEFGSAYAPSLATTPAAYWFDANGAITISTPTNGASERWYPSPVSVSATQDNTQVISMYHQYQQFLSYAIAYGGSGYSAPTANGIALGSQYTPTLTTSIAGYWFDASGTIAFTNSLSGSGSTERWYTTTGSVSATAQGTNSITYYHQYLLTVTGGNNVSYSMPSPTSDNWYYAGTNTTVSSDWVWNTVSGQSRTAVTNFQIDGANQNPTRASSGTLTTFLMTFDTSHTVAFASTVQYCLTVNGGNNITYGTASPTGDGWYDSGTSTTVSSDGVWGRSSGVGNRVESWQVDGNAPTYVTSEAAITTAGITMSAPHSIAFATVTQYEVTLDAGATSALSSITPPTISADNYWYDSGTSVSVTLYGVYGRSAGTGSRTASFTLDGGSPTDEATASTFSAFSTNSIDAPHSITATTVTQYLLTDDDPTGSENGITAPTIAGDTGWYDSGTSVTVVLNNVYGLVQGTSRNNLVSYTQGGTTMPVVRSGSGTLTESTVVMNAPVTISATYVVQYYLAISNDCYDAAVSATSPTGDGWYDSGMSMDVQCSGINTRIGGTGKRAEDYYWDSGSPTTVATTGNYTTSSVNMNSTHTLNVDALAEFQLTFAASPSLGGSSFTSTLPSISGDTGWYDAGSVVSISANPNAYWSFTSWSSSSGSITFGSITSQSTTAAIGDAGTITADFTLATPLSAGSITPLSPTVDNGQSITLTANPAGGTHSYSYQWYTGAGCASPISGAGSQTYNASPSSTMTYYYEVNDSTYLSVGACSAGDTVTVNPALATSPVIAVSPGTIDSGQSATLTNTTPFSGGTSPYTCQWLEEAPGASSYSDLGSSFSCTTSLTPPISTGALSSAGTWYFELQVTDSANAFVTSNAVAVVVNSQLTVSVSPSPVTVDQGQSSSLTSGAVNTGTSPYAYQWYEEAPGANSYSAIVGANSSRYTFVTSVSTAIGSWQFELQVTDSGSPAEAVNSSAVGVTVNSRLVPPSVSASSSSINQGQSSSLTSRAVTTGTLPYTYQWLEKAPGASSHITISGANSSAYTFVATSSTTGGIWSFELRVTDGASASVTSTQILVTVVSTPTLTISCNRASLVVGSATRCKATVQGYGKGPGFAPTGNVSWSSSSSGTFSTTSCKLSRVVGGITITHHSYSICSVKFTPTAPGSPVVLTASYGGDSKNLPSVGSRNLTVAMKVTKTTVICTPRSAVADSSTVITCKAKVAGYLPSGTVNWSQTGTGTISLNSTTCTLSRGVCSVAMTGSTSGHVVVTATYTGDSNNRGSFRTARLTITKAPTTTSVYCTQSSGAGKSITCTATVTGVYLSHTGAVTWSKVTGVGVSFSSKTCTLSSGSCSVTFTATTAGRLEIKAAYSGDSNNLKSSVTLILTVT